MTNKPNSTSPPKSGMFKCGMLAFIFALIAAPPALSQSTNNMGINLQDYSERREDRLFADVMKTARRFYKAASDTTLANIDANGWPTEDAQLYVWSGLANMHGTYKMSFNGQANVSVRGLAGSVVNKAYNAATNTTTADVLITTTGTANCNLLFASTNYSGTLNTGVKNIKLMRPVTPGSTSSYPTTTTFTDQIKTLVSKFSVLRFMGFCSINSSNVTSWDQRALPTDATTQLRKLPDTLNTNFGPIDVGGCYEYAIQFCNETNKDLWVNIPLKVDDNYVTQLATLIKNNLNSNLKVYVEYSNEIWNGGPGFTQASENLTLATNEVNAGGSPLNHDGETNTSIWGWRRPGKRTVEISNIFRSVFGDAAMMTRVRPVLMGQAGVAARSPGLALRLIEAIYSHVTPWCATPHPVNYYIYGAGGSGYYNPNYSQTPPLDLNNFWTSASMDLNNWSYQKNDADWAIMYGLKRIAYEGGPSLDVSGTLTSAAWADPRMENEIIEHHDYWSSIGGDLLVYFDTCTSTNWGFTQSIFDLNTPKLLGIDYLNTHPRAALTHGFGLPSTISPSSGNLIFSAVKDYLVAGNLLFDPNEKGMASYTVRVDTPGYYDVSVQAIDKYSYTGSLRVTIDGSTITGTASLNAPSQISAKISTGYLTAGFHALRLTNIGTVSLGISNLYVTKSAAQILHYKFDEGSGTTVTDSSGGHTTTVPGAKWTTLGKLGGAYNNASDLSSLPIRFSPANQSDLNFNPSTDDFTMSCWVKISPTVPVTYRPFIAKFQGSQNTNYQYMLWLPNNFTRLGAYVGNKGAFFSLPAAINDDQWHLITLTNATISGTKKFTMYYDDGVGSKASLPVTTGTGGITSGTCQIYPGVGSGGVGQMDDLRILNRAITQDEVGQIYNGTFAP